MAFDAAALDVAAIGRGITLLSGDCRTVLPTLAANSVQCVVTSPPYYALRDYGVAGQIGLEATPDEFIAQMVAVFREVRRVLRDDGTCWINLGDSYWNGGGEKRDGGHGFVDGGKTKLLAAKGALLQAKCSASGMKPKDLMMMPARVALALQADGWWLRSAIVWAKPNPMPESVTDRPTSAYEMVYLLTKRSRYYYDADAVREPLAAKTYTTFGCEHRPQGNDAMGNVKSDNWGSSLAVRKPKLNGAGEIAGANMRNVWTIATSPFSAAHFATFPPELAERCIKAGTSERGCCAACGAPWVRVVERGEPSKQTTRGLQPWAAVTGQRDSYNGLPLRETTTTGWAPTCKCDAAVVPCTILDPFAGAGTALLVADRLQRNAIGIELNTAYTEMAMERVRADAPLFSSWPPAEDPADQRMAADAMQRDLFGC